MRFQPFSAEHKAAFRNNSIANAQPLQYWVIAIILRAKAHGPHPEDIGVARGHEDDLLITHVLYRIDRHYGHSCSRTSKGGERHVQVHSNLELLAGIC